MLNGRKVTKELLKEMEQGTKPETNADKIRAMSDREIAAFLAGKFTDHETEKSVQKGEVLTATYISEMAHTWFVAWMQWLQQPAEVDNAENR